MRVSESVSCSSGLGAARCRVDAGPSGIGRGVAKRGGFTGSCQGVGGDSALARTRPTLPVIHPD